MSWLEHLRTLFRPQAAPVLSPQQSRQLAQWQALPACDWQQDSRRCRYLIVDVEASGLNLKQDRLISIGAVALEHNVISARDAFEVVLRQDTVSSRENILIHGISGAEQREGQEPADALLQFLAYSQHTPLVAYHAFFDQAMIARAMQQQLGLRYAPRWLDLAWLLPALFPEIYGGIVGLDKWLDAFGIQNFQRHNAISDCLATAQLLQLTLQRAAERGIHSPQGLAATERMQRNRIS